MFHISYQNKSLRIIEINFLFQDLLFLGLTLLIIFGFLHSIRKIKMVKKRCCLHNNAIFTIHSIDILHEKLEFRLSLIM